MDRLLEERVWRRAGRCCDSRLVHPRPHKWAYHLRYDGPLLIGRAAIGRTTVVVLEINLPRRVALRKAPIAEGVFLPGGIISSTE